MLITLHLTNLNILKATGRSDIFFKLEIAKKIIGFIAILIGLFFGLFGMLYSLVITSYICFGLNAYFSGVVIKYGIREQLIDILPSFILSILVGVTTYFAINLLSEGVYIDMIMMIIVYSTMYFSISKFLKFEALDLFLSVINERIFKRI
jgi:teichuronic acid exporter